MGEVVYEFECPSDLTTRLSMVRRALGTLEAGVGAHIASSSGDARCRELLRLIDGVRRLLGRVSTSERERTGGSSTEDPDWKLRPRREL